jgi:hypothetical protein
VGDRVMLWEYIQGRWNGQVAADMYKGPSKKLLQKVRPLGGPKRKWTIVEDNDPAGLKSSKARAEK